MGAFLNVKINAAGLEDKEFASQIIREGEAIVEKANELEAEILKIVNSKLSSVYAMLYKIDLAGPPDKPICFFYHRLSYFRSIFPDSRIKYRGFCFIFAYV